MAQRSGLDSRSGVETKRLRNCGCSGSWLSELSGRWRRLQQVHVSKSAPQAMSQCKAVTVKDALGRPQHPRPLCRPVSPGVRAIARCGLLRQEVFQSRPRAILQIEGKQKFAKGTNQISNEDMVFGIWTLAWISLAWNAPVRPRRNHQPPRPRLPGQVAVRFALGEHAGARHV